MIQLHISKMQTYNTEGTSPFPSYASHHSRRSSLDDNDKFTNHCNGALAKIRLTYIRLLYVLCVCTL